ncbi:MAG: hypothetical protein A2Y10_17430 [Planctomycetes bacterium GWF2_41_51]|nr:MAG: hypothetical protein A2Y10_17430 [Planctomycetes bacterium GWF2_41_51]HBG28009.1 hypothetical protein [Phycisphaerales bacterium]
MVLKRSFGAAFTLVELLVVISIIALLLAVLLPSLSKAREQSRRTVCRSNMRQIAVSNFTYAASHDGKLLSKNPLGHVWNANGYDLLFPSNVDKTQFLDILVPKVYKLYSCPSTKLYSPEPVEYRGVCDPADPDGTVDYATNLVYLAGLGYKEVCSAFDGKIGVMFDTPIRTATLKMSQNNSRMYLMADRSIWWKDYTGNGAHLGSINHPKYGLGNDFKGVGLAEFEKMVSGSNRCYADGHAEWVLPSVMGTNEGPMVNGGHYSHWAKLRLYFW